MTKVSSLNLSLMHKFLMTNKRILLSSSKILLSICYKLHVWISSYSWYVHSVHSYCWSSFLLGNKPPGMVPLKGQYMGKDISRLAHYYQIPLNAPAVSVAMTQPNLQHCLSLQSGNWSIFSSSVILLTSNLWNACVCMYILLVFYCSAFI